MEIPTDSTLSIVEEYSEKTKHKVVVLNKTPRGIYIKLCTKSDGDVIVNIQMIILQVVIVGLIMKNSILNIMFLEILI